MMVGLGAIELLAFLVFGGGFLGGGVLGMPPGERDVKLAQVPKADVVLYSEWSARGEGKPGAKGVDGFAADPEVLGFIKAIDEAIQIAADENSNRPEEKVLAKHMLPMMRILVNRPGCVCLDVDAQDVMKRLVDPPEVPRFMPPFFAFLPSVEATMVINGGDQADAIAEHIEGLLELMPEGQRTEDIQRQTFPMPMEGASLTLHRHGEYFILGWGKDSVDDAIEGLDGKREGLKTSEPFEAAMKTVLLDRPGSLMYFNLQGAVQKAVKEMGPQGLVVAAAVKQLGLDTVESLSLCTGVVDGQLHTRGLLKNNGDTEGVLKLAAGRKLTAEDFANVPGDADLLLAFTLDAPKILETVRTIIGQAGEQPKQMFEQILEQLESELQVKFEEDLFAAFGQKWMAYDSPSQGGVLITAPLLGLEVKDHEKAKVVFEKLMTVLSESFPPLDDGRFRRGVKLSKDSFLDHDVYFVNHIGREQPFAPAFVLTKSHLLVAPHPQQIKAHLRFLNSKDARFADIFAATVQHQGGELFAFSHSEPELFSRYFFGITPVFASLMFADIQREMPSLNAFDFPSARAFLPYIGKGLFTKERTEEGILWNSRQALPIPGASALFLTSPVYLFLGVNRSREMRAIEAAPAIQVN